MTLNEACLLIADCPHTTARDESVGFPLVRTPNVGFGRLVYEDMHRVSKDVYDLRNKRAIPMAGDLIYAREAPAGNVAVIERDEKVCLGQRTVLLRPNPDIVDSYYLAYYLLMPEHRNELIGQASGATVLHVNLADIRSLKVRFPRLETQKKIATVLNDYYAAIANCRKQIALLEEAAMRLYREWFGDGKGEKWPISAIGEYMNGFAFKPSDFQTQGLPILKIREMQNGVSPDTPRNDGGRVPAKYRVVSGEIVFSWSATLEVVYWSGETALLNQHLFKVTPKHGFSRPFVYQAIKASLETFRNLAHGATMQHIQRGKLDEVTVSIPSQETLRKFNEKAIPLYDAQMHLSEMIHNLTEARDRLLPKLMSGEVAV